MISRNEQINRRRRQLPYDIINAFRLIYPVLGAGENSAVGIRTTPNIPDGPNPELGMPRRGRTLHCLLAVIAGGRVPREE